jgi:hypothetical protein
MTPNNVDVDSSSSSSSSYVTAAAFGAINVTQSPSSPFVIDAAFCTQLNENASQTINSFNDRPSRMQSSSDSTDVHIEIARVINDIGVPLVAIFGLLGNALNLAVLTRKRLQRTMADRLERSAHAGLVALAASDALVCLTYAATSFVLRRRAVVYGRDQSLAALYFDAYREPVLNVFLLSSTWLTVVMAVERYVAVCRPLHARGFISLTGTRVAIAAVFASSLAVNAPRFWHYVAAAKPCSAMVSQHLRALADACEAAVVTPPCRYYVKQTGLLYAEHPTFVNVYGIVYFIFDILLPLPVLTFCNVCLVLALRRSRRLQQQQSQNARGMIVMTTRSTNAPPVAVTGRGSVGGQTAVVGNGVGGSVVTSGVKTSHDRLTRTLIGLILLLTFLVGPSEFLGFFREYVLTGRGSPANQHRYRVYHTATVVANFLLLVNFAVNFVLYCVVNVNFRRTCWDLVTCRCLRMRRRRGSNGATRSAYCGDGGPSSLVVAERRKARMCNETYELIVGGQSANEVSGMNSVSTAGVDGLDLRCGVRDHARRRSDNSSSIAVTVLR